LEGDIFRGHGRLLCSGRFVEVTDRLHLLFIIGGGWSQWRLDSRVRSPADQRLKERSWAVGGARGWNCGKERGILIFYDCPHAIAFTGPFPILRGRPPAEARCFARSRPAEAFAFIFSSIGGFDRWRQSWKT
jgi:hypothetical protein